MKKEKETKTDNAQTIAELLAELEQARAELEAARESLAKKRTSKKSARPAHVEFLRSAPARAALAIAATGKTATALVPAYLATTLLAQASHATGAARQTACTVSRGIAYTAGVCPDMFPAEITARFDGLKADIQTVAGWLELIGLGDDYNIIPKDALQAISDEPENARNIYADFLNGLRLRALEVQKKAFKPEDFAKIEEDSREVMPWNFESWEVITEAK